MVEIEHRICQFYIDCIHGIRATPKMVVPFLDSSECGDQGGSSYQLRTPPMGKTNHHVHYDCVCLTNGIVEY